MTVRELRRKYLDFFVSKGHVEHASGSLVPVDVTGRLDESLLFNGAGMVQFKPYFRGVATPPNPRLATSQKCLRTGDIDEVGDETHLTFFEMLGNFSFGDYFKADAIAYSWEFLTSQAWLGLDPQKLSFTVFTEDDEAFSEWSKHLSAAGIDPSRRVFRLGEETNYWPAGAFSSGPPGPCGPNSEMFYWTGDGYPPEGPYSADDYLRDEAAGKWLEIWNDVFIQYEWQGALRNPQRPSDGYEKTGMPELPFRSVDTGMGIERTVAVLGGHSSVYETDAFTPIFAMLEELQPGLSYRNGSPEVVRAMRIVADHLRAAVFCIADGVLPSNAGRGYVLRRLIRRAVVKGARTLGFDQPFLYLAAQSVIVNFGEHYHEIVERSSTITEILKNEEAQFRRTMSLGIQMLGEMLGSLEPGQPLSGDQAFALHDTYGFPLEITREVADESGIPVDTEGFERAMLEAQERSRLSAGMDTVYGGVARLQFGDDAATPTQFLGYDACTSHALIKGALPAVNDGSVSEAFVVALDRTPFYAESGGQVADTGVLIGEGFRLNVTDVTKQDGVFVHLVESADGLHPWTEMSEDEAKAYLTERYFNQIVEAHVDESRRADVVRNHTATHLLHAALRQVVGEHVTQAGSLVAPDHLRFDFTHGAALSPQDVQAVEDLVNQKVWEAEPVVVYPDTALADARAMGAMALFGEKYADRVRVVQIGGMPPTEPSFSRELCGGVHVRNTGEIGLFKILHEASAASGVRRITAVTGRRSLDWVRETVATLDESAAKLKSKPSDLPAAIDRTLETLREERKKREKLSQQGTGDAGETVQIGTVRLVVQKAADLDTAAVKSLADRAVDTGADVVALIINVADGKVAVACKVGPEALKVGVKAGDLVREVAQVLGGGGGGRPDFATAGGKDASKIDEAVARAKDVVSGLVG